MIKCPICQHEAMSGAIYCSECGTLLGKPSGVSTQTVSRTDPRMADLEKVPPPPPETIDALEGVNLALHIIQTGQILPLTGRDEFTLGRISEGQSIIPDIDLTSYNAYKQGVSRLHSMIKLHEEEVTITDLGSANSTRINGEVIGPYSPTKLNHGDLIALGKLKIQILIRPL